MTREEIIKELENYIPWADEYEADIEVLTGALELLKQELCGDAISRQAVLDGLASIAKAKAKSDAQKSLIGRVMFFTEHLPSVNPQEPKTGHWIYKNLKGQFCSACDEQSIWKFNYCPNCGCRMVEPQESENKE